MRVSSGQKSTNFKFYYSFTVMAPNSEQPGSQGSIWPSETEAQRQISFAQSVILHDRETLCSSCSKSELFSVIQKEVMNSDLQDPKAET